MVSNSWDVERLIQLVEENSAEALFVDPLANLGTYHTTDCHKFSKLLEEHNWSNKCLIIDDKLVSGRLNVFEIFNKPQHPHILYFESGNKYLQLGLDLQMAGIVFVKKQYSSELNTFRFNTGTVIYQTGVAKFPSYNREQFLARMLRLTKNAEILCACLDSLNQNKKGVVLTFPKNWRELGWSHGGGIVAVTFEEKGENNRPCLYFLISLILEESKKGGIPFTKGVSFGFSGIHVSAASAMTQDRPPFLRFSIGEKSEKEMEKIWSDVKKSFMLFFKKYNL